MKTYEEGISFQNQGKKVDDWISSNFYTMIKFKQLFKEGMPPLPTNLTSCKLRWFQVCQHMPDPPIPMKPDGYIEIEEATIPTCNSDDEASAASIEMFVQV